MSELQDLLRSKDVREAKAALAAAERGKRAAKE